jgi:hypothetical protein
LWWWHVRCALQGYHPVAKVTSTPINLIYRKALGLKQQIRGKLPVAPIFGSINYELKLENTITTLQL